MKKRNLVDRITDLVGLPTEPLPGKPLVEILNDQSVLIENHKGIVGYNCETVNVQTTTGYIMIQGDQLMLHKISKEQLLIRGQIHCVKLNGR